MCDSFSGSKSRRTSGKGEPPLIDNTPQSSVKEYLTMPFKPDNSKDSNFLNGSKRLRTEKKCCKG